MNTSANVLTENTAIGCTQEGATDCRRKPARRPIGTRVLDLLCTAWFGATGRITRTILASLGIALGVAAYVALSGIAASNQAALLVRLDALGANLQLVTPGQDSTGQPVPLPDYAPDTIARQSSVEQVGVFLTAPSGARVFKNEFVPSTNGNALAVAVMRPGALGAVGVGLAQGHGIDRNNEHLPVAVLGSEAAYRLGVNEPGDRVLIDNAWYGVIGILEAAPQAQDLDSSVLIGADYALEHYPDQAGTIGRISRIYVRTSPGNAEALRRMIAHAANLSGGNVSVSASANLSEARNTTNDSLTALGLMIGIISLAVGGMSIANMMVVTVMERRGEIGLRRALGATRGAIRMQFVTEAAILSAIGGLAGVAIGAGAAIGMAAGTGQPPTLDWTGLPLAWVAAVMVGILAGIYPASRAARMTPTEALRGVVI